MANSESCKGGPLTLREQQIADATARGLTNKEMGVEFGISPETVKRHLASIYAKLSLRGRVELATHVIRTRPANEPRRRTHDELLGRSYELSRG